MKGLGVKAVRADAGFTQTEMAEKLGLGRNCYIDWENGKRTLEGEKFATFCKLCGRKPEEVRVAKSFYVRAV